MKTYWILKQKNIALKCKKHFVYILTKVLRSITQKKCVLTQQCFALKSNNFCDYRNTFAITFSEKMEAFFMFNEINKN